LTQSTTSATPAIPVSGVHVPGYTQIVWNWNTIADATGYKWNTVDNYFSAMDMGTANTHLQTNLTCSTPYTSYAWAYNGCGNSTSVMLTQSTLTCWTCGNPLPPITHTAGTVAPVTKTVTYGTVKNIPGDTSKCWITSNLGADHQASSSSDNTEASAGWYWQFNKMQGYKHDGTTRTPNTAWITEISEFSNWTTANDPCNIELGTGWRIPTSTEWSNVDEVGGWNNYNGPWNSALKIHRAGRIDYYYGTLGERGVRGYYWSSTQTGLITYSFCLSFSSSTSSLSSYQKAYGHTIRCIKD
jgi:uncharacterized protein (TIGR02145 family)